MMGGAVDVLLERVAAEHVAVVDEDAPAVDEGEEADKEVFVEGDEVAAEVIGD